MTKDELTRVSRNFVGHIATDPEAREAMNTARGDKTAMAKVINKYVDPKVSVTEADVDDIQNRVDQMYVPENQAAVPPDQSLTQIGKG